MTDWQMTGAALGRQTQAMELSRIIAQLASANQQLAAAHSASLARVHALQEELRATTTQKLSCLDSEDLQNRLKIVEDEEENEDEGRRRLETRLARLESLLSERCNSCRSRQRNLLRQEKENKLRARLERLEGLLNLRETNDSVDATNDVSEMSLHRVGVPEDTAERKSKSSTGSLDKAEGINRDRASEDDFRINEDRSSFCGKLDKGTVYSETTELLAELERLKNDRLEYQKTNERLLIDLADQMRTVQQLQQDCQASQARCEQVQRNLDQRNQQYDRLSEDLELAKRETGRLAKELDDLRVEKDTARATICSLEQDLQKSLLEKDKALAEVQRLKETIKTDKKDNSEPAANEDIATDSVATADDAEEGRSMTDRVANMELFKKELMLKREARQRAIAAVSSEMERLRQDLDAEKEAHSETARMLELLKSEQTASELPNQAEKNHKVSRITSKNGDGSQETTKRLEAERLTSILKVSDELRNDIRLQIEKVDDLRYQLESEPEQHRYRIRCLTEINNRAREALTVRERQTNKLKDYLAQILVRLGDRNFLETREDSGLECERQLEHINTLKSLYNERLKVLSELKESALKELVDVKEKLDHFLKKSENLEEDLKKAEEKIDTQDTEISNLESQLGLTKADCRDLQNQMSLINSLFTQMLLGASSADMNLDRLTQLLQENHELISEIAREEGTEAAALPKLLLDLVEQVEGNKEDQKRVDPQGTAETSGESEKKEDDRQEENIAHNLPKVWRVLLELLSCHAVDSPTVSVAATSDPNSCYKSVDTPAGPRLVISVSKTYIRLKELILEKKHLEKEMTRMKQLNSHLESKLGEQERRLSMVSVELSKTWNIVGRMQAQHQQLHTHEKILRYELQQKRKMLQELKQELEYCREKWESARQKNTNTEIEWRSLRREFAARKALAVHDSFNNSGESGFSDERGDDTDEEDEADEERIRHGPRRRSRKESPRASTSDTESEQPTDTELSESKTEFPINLEERTPTPETDAEMDDIEAVKEDDSNKTVFEESTPEQLQQDLNPLDQALTNVIQNLIGINGSAKADENSAEAENSKANVLVDDVEMNVKEEKGNNETVIENDFKEITSTEKADQIAEEKLLPSSEENLVVSGSVSSIFSIGPFMPGKTSNDETLVLNSPSFSTPVFGATTSSSTDTTTDTNTNESVSTELESCSPSSLAENSKLHETSELPKPAKIVAENDNLSVNSSTSLETVNVVSTAVSAPSTSTSSAQVSQGIKATRTPEEVLASRADRLKRLEEQADWLMKKMNATSRRGSALSSRLEELHQVYGEPPAPPPMPDVLPNCRLRTNSHDSPEEQSNSPSTTTAKNNEDVDKPPGENVP